ncbi:hypothetical protein Pmani_021352 [Petrolisthes manimaculis]|uniref:Queuosine 5'-phosphate N-glycosylase/hydrolase n=1 Tax=Petrolisthes manimaculis TaxID=1843537 RepID=A0AAE1U3A7_9EUCA|nr:hypothetical protein Pmani_021352 [Petrolisthes manimaculis]
MLWPREAGEFIASKCKDVQINRDGVKKAAVTITQAVIDGNVKLETFTQNELFPLHKGLSEEELANWIFLVDSLNFNFWTPDGEPKFTVQWNGKTYKGYMAMVAAINRAIDEGKRIYDPKYYTSLSIDEVKHIFRSLTSSTMPLFEERLRVMKEVGETLLDKYEGSFAEVIKKCEKSGIRLVELVTNDFPSFNDTAEFEGQKVAMFKRAQIVVSDTWLLFRGQGLGAFLDIDELTMFADYRVPQALAYFGALEYSESLTQKLKKQTLFKSGDREEAKIRGCSIHAVELIVEEARKILREQGTNPAGLNSIKTDFFFWEYRIKNSQLLMKIPYHRIRLDKPQEVDDDPMDETDLAEKVSWGEAMGWLEKFVNWAERHPAFPVAMVMRGHLYYKDVSLLRQQSVKQADIRDMFKRAAKKAEAAGIIREAQAASTASNATAKSPASTASNATAKSPQPTPEPEPVAGPSRPLTIDDLLDLDDPPPYGGFSSDSD